MRKPESLYQYLTGDHSPGRSMQERLRRLGCDIEWLMTGMKNPESLGIQSWAHFAAAHGGLAKDVDPDQMDRICQWIIALNPKQRNALEQMLTSMTSTS